jgi:hypothetical protein
MTGAVGTATRAARGRAGRRRRQQLGRVDTRGDRRLDRLDREGGLVASRRCGFGLDADHVAVEHRLATAAEVEAPAIDQVDGHVAVIASLDGFTRENLVSLTQDALVTRFVDGNDRPDDLGNFTS